MTTSCRQVVVAALILACCRIASAQDIGSTYTMDNATLLSVSGGYYTGRYYQAGSWSIDTSGGYAGDTSRSAASAGQVAYLHFRAAPGQYSVGLTWTTTYSSETIVRVLRDGVDVGGMTVSNAIAPGGDWTVAGRAFDNLATFTVPEGDDAQIVVTFSTSDPSKRTQMDAVCYKREELPPEPELPEAVEYVPIGSFHNVHWTGPPESDSQRYEVQQRTRADGVWSSWTGSGISYDPNTVTTAHAAAGTLTSPANAIQFRVRGTSADGSVTTEWVETEEHEVGPPAAPAAVEAFGLTTTSIKIQWEDTTGPSDTDNESKFVVEWRIGSEDPWEQLALVNSGVESYTHQGLESAVTYRYRVRAIRYSPPDQSAWSSEVTAQVLSSPGYGSAFGSFGSTAGNVSGRIGVRDRSLKITKAFTLWTDDRVLYGSAGEVYVGGGNSHAVFFGHRECGRRILYLGVTYCWAETITPEHPEGQGQTNWFKITVGRNGAIQVRTTTSDPIHGGLYNTQDAGQWEQLFKNWDTSFEPGGLGIDGTFAGSAGVFYPAMLKALIDDPHGLWTKPRITMPEGPLGGFEEVERTPEELAHGQLYKQFATLIYRSMNGEEINWPSIIPRCPGEDLDGYGLDGSNGAGGGSSFPGLGEYEPPDESDGENPIASSGAMPEKVKNLRPQIFELNDDPNSTLAFSAPVTDMTLPGIAGESWYIDLKDPCASWPEVKIYFDAGRITFRLMLLLLVYVQLFKATYTLLRQY